VFVLRFKIMCFEWYWTQYSQTFRIVGEQWITAPDNYLIVSIALGNFITHFCYCCHYDTSITGLFYRYVNTGRSQVTTFRTLLFSMSWSKVNDSLNYIRLYYINHSTISSPVSLINMIMATVTVSETQCFGVALLISQWM